MKFLIIISMTLFLATNGFGNETLKESIDINIEEGSTVRDQIRFIANENLSIPKYFQVKQNYPNPFNATTLIEYDLPERANTSIKIYNSIGELVTILENGIKEAGSYQIEWNGENSSRSTVSSGLYFYVVVANNFYSIKKMVLLK